MEDAGKPDENDVPRRLALKEMTLLEQSTKQVLRRLSKRPRSTRHAVEAGAPAHACLE